MAKGWFGNILKGAWNIGKGVLKNIPIVGGLVRGLEGLGEKLNFGKGAKDLENAKGSVLGDALGAALPGLISGGADLLTSHFSSKAEIRQRKDLMDYQHTLSQQDYQQELADKRQLIEEDRQYNSIGAQMARAEQAGVSPLAALGVSAGNSVGASSPTHQAVNAPAMGNNFLENIATLKQLDMMKAKNDAEVYRLKQAAELDKAKAKTEEHNAVMAEIRASNLPEFQKAELEKLVADKGAIVARAELDKSLKLTEDTSRDIINRLNEAKIKLTNEQSRNEFAKTIINAFEASYLSKHGEYPPTNATDRLIDSIRHALLGDKEDYDKFMNWDAGLLGEILSKIMGHINKDQYPDFVRWLDMMRSHSRK